MIDYKFKMKFEFKIYKLVLFKPTIKSMMFYFKINRILCQKYQV